jgi:RHS repeat-associated protein
MIMDVMAVVCAGLSVLSVTCPSTFFFSPAERYTTRANAIKGGVEMIPIKAQQEGEANSWKFAAGSLDSSTGLYKFGTRYYDPTLGRWTQLDSAGTGYTYANDNPVNEVDPSGTTTIDQWQIFFGITCIVGAGLAVAGLLLSTAGLGFPLIIAAALSGCLLAVIAAFVAVILAHYNLNAAPSS